MGRKSSAKTQSRESSTTSGTPPARRMPTGLIVAAIIAFVAVVGGYAYVTTGRTAPAADHSAHAAAPANLDEQPPAAKYGPHKQAMLPPLPTQAYAPPRPPDVVRAAYVFAAEHPEVLSYVPCFC